MCVAAKERRKKSPLLSESMLLPLPGNHLFEAEVASQDKQCRKSNMYHHYDANVHAKIAKSACEKTLSLKDTTLGIMYKTLPVRKWSRR